MNTVAHNSSPSNGDALRNAPVVPVAVLLVDDEREFVETLAERLLMRHIHCRIAYDGESALETIAVDEPEVMLLDIKMPGIDGMEVLRRVKANTPRIEVVMLTGHGNETDRDNCLALGAFAYLQKPVDIRVLSDTLRRASQHHRQKRELPTGETG